MTFIGRTLILAATLGLLHATFATYDHLSQLKALNQLNDSPSQLPFNIVIECFSALVVFILGVTLNASPLKEITWASEMSRRSIDELDARIGFASMNYRAKQIFGGTK